MVQWLHAGKLPRHHFRTQGAPILDLKSREGVSRELQRELLDALKVQNQEHADLRGGNSDLMSRISSYELAYKMQEHAPEAVDIESETAATKELYGLNQDRTRDFGTSAYWLGVW